MKKENMFQCSGTTRDDNNRYCKNTRSQKAMNKKE